jgi:hypothetical protein
MWLLQLGCKILINYTRLGRWVLGRYIFTYLARQNNKYLVVLSEVLLPLKKVPLIVPFNFVFSVAAVLRFFSFPKYRPDYGL